jgi:hypothetical protein
MTQTTLTAVTQTTLTADAETIHTIVTLAYRIEGRTEIPVEEWNARCDTVRDAIEAAR